MVEVGVGVEDMRDRQSQLLHLAENALVRSAGIDNNGLFRDRIANDRTIATKRRDRECLSDHAGHDGRMLPSKPIRVQAE